MMENENKRERGVGTRGKRFPKLESPHTFPTLEDDRRRAYERTPESKERRKVVRSVRWKKLRLRILDRDPLCKICLQYGRTTPSSVVDHIIRHAGPDDDLAWDERNLQGLCPRCHSHKTQREAPAEKWRDRYGRKI